MSDEIIEELWQIKDSIAREHEILRERLGIRPGTVLEFCEKSGKMIVSKMEERDAVDEVYGTLGRGRRSDDIIRELRGAV